MECELDEHVYGALPTAQHLTWEGSRTRLSHAVSAALSSSAKVRPVLNSVETAELLSQLWLKVSKDSERWACQTGSTV